MARFVSPVLFVCSLCLSPGLVRPATAVEGFCLRNEVRGVDISNNSLISAAEIAFNMDSRIGIGCYPPTGRQWLYPNGGVVLNDESGVFRSVPRTNRIELVRTRVPLVPGSEFEGVYTCQSTNQVLLIGIYTGATFQSATGPVIRPPLALAVTTPPSQHPPTFTVTCLTSLTPPTTLTWSLDGSTLNDNTDTTQTLTDAVSSSYTNTLTVAGNFPGDYTCTTSNDRGNSTLNITVEAPSGPPMAVTVSPAGNNSVLVEWLPPNNTRGHRLYYTDQVTNITLNTTVLGSASSSAVLEGLTSMVEYAITVQAFADLPGEQSQTVSITLQAPPPPDGLTLLPLTPSSIRASWSPVVNATGYNIRFSPNTTTACQDTPSGQSTVAMVTQAELRGLEEATMYRVMVQSIGQEAVGLFSEAFESRTFDAVPSGPPLNVRAVANGDGTMVTVTWDPPTCSDRNSRVISSYSIRHGFAGGDDPTLVAMVTTQFFTISGQDLQPFVEYVAMVAAANQNGTGPFSEPATAVVIGIPGRVPPPVAVSDIVSVLLTWSPPPSGSGRGHITQYKLDWRFAGRTNLVGSTTVAGGVTELRVPRLYPQTSYSFTVFPATIVGQGPGETVNATTTPIGRVDNLSARRLNSTSYEVTWTPLPSQDASYRLFVLSQTGLTLVAPLTLPPRSSVAVVTGLRVGEEAEFQMAVVVVVPSGREVEGPRTSAGTDTVAMAAVIAGAVIGSVIVVLLLIIAVLCAYLIWRKGRSGKFEIARRHRNNGLELKPRPTPLPLPEFDLQSGSLPTAKPVIEQYPKDTIALEGEKVILAPLVTGTPPPTIAWFHDGCMVTGDYATEITSRGALTFVCVELKHAGTYRFTVSNQAGSVQGQVTLFVHSENDTDLATIKGIPLLDTLAVPLAGFGGYVAKQHGNNNRGFRDQYFTLPTSEEGHSLRVSGWPENKTRNRFVNIIPYDENRVKLKPVASLSHDYINASYVDGYFMPGKFIATQGPNEESVEDFWRMVWQLRPPTIVMITNVMEGSKFKCEQYWPEYGSMVHGPFKVVLADQLVFADFTVRTLLLSLVSKANLTPFKVFQFHFTSWPDHGVPDYVTPMLSFHRRTMAEHRPTKGPMVVHCSAGVGRTGTFLAIELALQQAKEEERVDIPAIVTRLRNQRMKMVQTAEQYVFVHDAVLEALTCGNTQIPAQDLNQAVAKLRQWDPKTGQTGFENQFKVLSQVSIEDDANLCSTALQYNEKNRGTANLPTDRWRVILKAEHPDYINASFAHGYKQKKAFIIAQGPLESTTRDFWKMAYERHCSAIVMLSALMEEEEEVCCRYWPSGGMEQYGEYSVTLSEESMYDGFLERVFSLTDCKSGQTHRLSQFQILDWSSDGSCKNPQGVISAINCVNSAHSRNGTGPVIIHCSDTISRSGVYCSAATVIECCKTEGVVDVFQIVKALRLQKPGSVPTVELYQLIHELMQVYLQSFANYSNFK